MEKYVLPKQPKRKPSLDEIVRFHEAKRKQDLVKLILHIQDQVTKYKKLKGGECSFSSFWTGGCDDAMKEWAENTFDPEKNGIAAAFGPDGPLARAFDPEKNGVADSFRKFGADTEAAFKDIGNKIENAFSKESLDKAFGSVNDFFGNLVTNPLEFMTLLITIAEMVPGVAAATDAALIASEMAQGIEPDPAEVAAMIGNVALASGIGGAVAKKVENAVDSAVPASVLASYRDKLGRDLATDVGKAVAKGTEGLLKKQRRPSVKERKAQALLGIFNSIANFLTAGAFPTYRLDEQELFNQSKAKRTSAIKDAVTNEYGLNNIFAPPPTKTINNPYEVFDRFIKEGKDVVADDVGTHVWRVRGIGDFPIKLKPNKITLANSRAGFPEIEDTAKWLQLMFGLTTDQAIDALYDYGIGLKVDGSGTIEQNEGYTKFQDEQRWLHPVVLYKREGQRGYNTGTNGGSVPANFYWNDLQTAGIRKQDGQPYYRKDGSSYDDPPSPEIMKEYFKLVPLTKIEKQKKLIIEDIPGTIGGKRTYMVDYDAVVPLTDDEVDRLADQLKREGYALISIVEAKRLGFNEQQRPKFKMARIQDDVEIQTEKNRRLQESIKRKEEQALAEQQRKEARTKLIDSTKTNPNEQSKLLDLIKTKGYYAVDRELLSDETIAQADAFIQQKEEAKLKAQQDKVNGLKLQLLDCLKAGQNCNQYVDALSKEGARDVANEAYREDQQRKTQEAGIDNASLSQIQTAFNELKTKLPQEEQNYFRFTLYPKEPASSNPDDLKLWREMVLKKTDDIKTRLAEIEAERKQRAEQEVYYNSPEYAELVKKQEEESIRIANEEKAKAEQALQSIKKQNFDGLMAKFLEIQPDADVGQVRSTWMNIRNTNPDMYLSALEQFGFNTTQENQELNMTGELAPLVEMSGNGRKKNKSSKQMNSVASYMPQTARAWTLMASAKRAKEIERKNKIQPAKYRPALYNTADAAGNFRKYGMVGGCMNCQNTCGCSE